MLDKLKRWRGAIVGHVVAVSGSALLVLQQLKAIDLHPLLPEHQADAIIAGISVAVVFVSLMTTPIGTKDAP